MKVAAVQLGLHPNNPERAVSEAELQVRDAAARGARLICLPEHWLLSKVLTRQDTIIRRLSGVASELGVFLNLGANYERRGNKTRLTSHTISPAGGIISRQDKMHLYRRETREAQQGSRLGLADIDGYKVGVLVCHDAVFPETARTLTLMGAELLVVPSLIVAKGMRPWLAYLRARAFENRVPIVSPNVFHPPKFLGGSCIMDLRYDRRERIMQLVERKAGPRRTALVESFELEANRAPRKERLWEVLRSDAVRRLYSAFRSKR
ncbi:MAG: carbon-nitrogen hydrolase family protein [Thaumarchaeota archaeon]|nr:carbon-nitrogen hydrolase family protein [Nitrososphaerota archaeon]